MRTRFSILPSLFSDTVQPKGAKDLRGRQNAAGAVPSSLSLEPAVCPGSFLTSTALSPNESNKRRETVLVSPTLCLVGPGVGGAVRDPGAAANTDPFRQWCWHRQEARSYVTHPRAFMVFSPSGNRKEPPFGMFMCCSGGCRGEEHGMSKHSACLTALVWAGSMNLNGTAKKSL